MNVKETTIIDRCFVQYFAVYLTAGLEDAWDNLPNTIGASCKPHSITGANYCRAGTLFYLETAIIDLIDNNAFNSGRGWTALRRALPGSYLL
jgi:hypothetical protein